MMLLHTHCPTTTGPFANLNPQIQILVVFYVVQERCETHFEAPKSWKGRSGYSGGTSGQVTNSWLWKIQPQKNAWEQEFKYCQIYQRVKNWGENKFQADVFFIILFLLSFLETKPKHVWQTGWLPARPTLSQFSSLKIRRSSNFL